MKLKKFPILSNSQFSISVINSVFLVTFFACLTLSNSVRSQVDINQHYKNISQKGYKVLAKGNLEESIKLFKRALELKPKNGVSAYDMACSYARKSETDTAIMWLTQAIEWGYHDLKHWEKDKDLDNMRSDSRYLELTERLKTNVETLSKKKTSPQEEATRLVVMIKSSIGLGAGIIFGRDNDNIYIVTANHVVRSKTETADNVQVQFKDSVEQWWPTTVTEHFDTNLDIAVLAIKHLQKDHFDFCQLPLARLGDTKSLSRGDEVYAVGYPNGIPWAMQLTADKIMSVVGKEISFESYFVQPGLSGGAILNGSGEIIGLMRADAPPYGKAINFETIIKQLREWNIPLKLRRNIKNTRSPLHLSASSGEIKKNQQLITDCLNLNAKDKRYRTPLHEAISNGHVEIVKLLLAAGANSITWTFVDNKEKKRREWKTSLHLAIEEKQLEIVKVLLENKVPVNIKTFNKYSKTKKTWEGTTPLHLATRENSVAIVKTLIKYRADVNALDGDRKAPLFLAAQYSLPEIAKLLIDSGADVNIKLYSGETPLHYAVHHNAIEVADILLTKGADPNIESRYWNHKGRHPLSMTVYDNKVKFVKRLLEAGANVDIRSSEPSQLHLAAKKGFDEVVKLLLRYGADVNSGKEKSKLTPLFRAVEGGNYKAAKILIANGADVNIKESYRGETPIYFIAKSNSADIGALLLAEGADINSRNERDSTPLHYAVSNKVTKIVDFLLTNGADPNLENFAQYTPLHIAIKDGSTDIVKLLLKAGANPQIKFYNEYSLLHKVARGNNLELLELLLIAGSNPNEKDSRHGETPLHIIASKRYEHTVEMIQLLLKHGANINAKARYYNRSVLYYASRGRINDNQSAEIVKLLIDAGAKVESIADADETPLHIAVGSWGGGRDRGNMNATRVLIAHGAKVDAISQHNTTPLHIAVRNRNGVAEKAEIIKILLSAGAAVDPKDDKGKTPLHYTGSNIICNLLIKNGADVNAKDNESHTPLDVALKKRNSETVRCLRTEGNR